jgi:hypothetical protein
MNPFEHNIRRAHGGPWEECGAIEAFNDESMNQSTRIVYEARRTGIHRIVATTLIQRETGRIRLNVSEMDE